MNENTEIKKNLTPQRFSRVSLKKFKTFEEADAERKDHRFEVEAKVKIRRRRDNTFDLTVALPIKKENSKK